MASRQEAGKFRDRKSFWETRESLRGWKVKSRGVSVALAVVEAISGVFSQATKLTDLRMLSVEDTALTGLAAMALNVNCSIGVEASPAMPKTYTRDTKGVYCLEMALFWR